MTDSAGPAPEQQSFGEALAELDRIVTALEGGQLELEESMTRYERGVSLLKALQAKLTDAQQKVTMLIGELEEETGGEAEAPSGSSSASSAGGDTSQEVPF
jgi:exodeoxyribonuclease VII small subunit